MDLVGLKDPSTLELSTKQTNSFGLCVKQGPDAIDPTSVEIIN